MNSEIFEVVAAWQETKLPVTLIALDGVYPSMRYPGATGAPFVRVGITVNGQTVFEATVPGTGTAHEWLKQVASVMGLPEPTSGGWRDPLSVTNAHAGWYEAREKEAQIALLDKGAPSMAVLQATQYKEVAEAAIQRLSEWELGELLPYVWHNHASAPDRVGVQYAYLIAREAIRRGKHTDKLVRCYFAEARKVGMSIANLDEARMGLSDPHQEVRRAAVIRLAELGDQATVNSVALDESRSAWERFPAIARGTPSVLEPLLKHTESQIRQAALGRIGKPAFAVLLNDPDESVAYSLEQALIQAPDEKEANRMLVSLAQRQPVDRAATAAAEALRARGFKIQVVEKYLNHHARVPTLVGYEVRFA